MLNVLFQSIAFYTGGIKVWQSKTTQINTGQAKAYFYEKPKHIYKNTPTHTDKNSLESVSK